MKILLTGSNGFIGSQIKKALNLQKQQVLELNVDFFADSTWPSKLLDFLNMNAPQGILHVGANSNTLETDVQSIMETNFLATEILASWASSRSVPLVFSSSAACYGAIGILPSNLYAWSKFTAEKVATSNGGLALRYFNVYGPGEEKKGKMSSIFYQAWIAQKKNRPVRLFPRKPERDFVYVNDVVKANLLALNNFSKITVGTYEVGSGQARTYEEGLRLMGIPFSYFSEDVIPHGYQFRTESNRDRWLPGWEPGFTLEKGLEQYLSYLKKSEVAL